MIDHITAATRCTGFLFAFAVFFGSVPVAQETQRFAGAQENNSQQGCPTVAVTCPSSFSYGAPVTFTAVISNAGSEVIPKYYWEVSAGTIIEGQGTPAIKVDTTDTGGHSFTATVTIQGLAKICGNVASCSLFPGLPAPPSVLFDSYKPKSSYRKCKTHLHRRRTRRRV